MLMMRSYAERQVLAYTIGIPFESVHVVSTQDTDITPFGTGAYASRQTYVGGMAIRQSAELLKDKILKQAARIANTEADLLDIENGNIVRQDTGETLMTVGDVATEALYSMTNAEHITAESTHQCTSNAFSMGCAFAEVEVDIPLGKVKILKLINVHDAGMLINPQLAEAQVHGGMSMSIGYGLYETLQYDQNTGKPLNGNLLDYKLPTTMDHPHLEAQFVEFYEPTSAYGTKALGEPPAVPAAPAIRNAILQATGVGIDEAPMTPHVLFKRFSEEGLIK